MTSHGMSDRIVETRDVCFTQDTINVTFKRPREQERIDDAADLIIRGDLSPKAFPKMQVVEFQGRLWSLANRRLWVFKKAEVPHITVTLMGYDSHDRFQSLASTSPDFYATMSSPDFFPRVRGVCKEIFTEYPDQDLPSLSPPRTPHVRGGRHWKTPTKAYKESIPSAGPPGSKPDRNTKRPKSPPSYKVAKDCTTRSSHLVYNDHHRRVPSHCRSPHSDLPSIPNSIVQPPPRNDRSYGSSHGKSKKRPHETEHHYLSSRPPQEACSPPPIKKYRPPSPVRDFRASPPAPSRVPLEECSSPPAKKSKAPAHRRELKASSPIPSTRYQEECSPPRTKKFKPLAHAREFKVSSPITSARHQDECSSPPPMKSRAPTHVRELKVSYPIPSTRHQEKCSSPATKKPISPTRLREVKASPSAPKPPVPTPRDRHTAPRPVKEARLPSPARRTRSSERKADPPQNLPSRRTTEPKALGSDRHLYRQNPLDQCPALPSLSKDKYSQKGREVKSSTSRAADKPPPPLASAPKRSRTSRATSNPKNFNYGFHNCVRKRPKASKGSKKTIASLSTKSSSTQLPDPVVDVCDPLPASPKTQHDSPEKPPEPLPSSSTAATLSTATKKKQMDDNFTPNSLIPSVPALKSPPLTCSARKNLEVHSDLEVHPPSFSTPMSSDPKANHIYHSVSGMSPTTKTRQKAPELVECTGKEEFMSEAERNLFRLNPQATTVDPEQTTSKATLNTKDQQTLDNIIQLLLKETRSTSLQTAHAMPPVGTLQEEPIESESPHPLVPPKKNVDVVLLKQQDKPRDISKQPNVHESVVDCPVQYDTKGQLFESALKVLGPLVAPSTGFYGDRDVHRAAANVGVTVTAVDPPKLQPSTPVKDVPEPQPGIQAGSAIDCHQQGKRALSRGSGFLEMARTATSEVTLELTKATQANPTSGNEAGDFPKRITRGQIKRQKEMQRKMEKQKRRELRGAELKRKEREAKSLQKEKSASSSKNVTTAIVPYDATRNDTMPSGLEATVHSGDMAYVKVDGELTETGVKGRRRLHPYLRILGPFRVARKCNAFAAILELPDDCSLKPSFTLTVLTKSRSPLGLSLPNKRLSIKLVPEAVLYKRVARRLRKRKVVHYLVKWKTLPATEATWESETIFDEHPHLLDQVDPPSFSNPYLLRNWKA